MTGRGRASPPGGSFTLHGTGTRTGKMGMEPIAKFPVPGPGSMQCEQFRIIYRNPLMSFVNANKGTANPEKAM